MKIIAIGKNYEGHAKEMGSKTPQKPVVFMKPETAILKGNIFNLPTFANTFHYELEVIIKISRTGKNIVASQANEYYDSIGLGLDFTARDLQSELKDKGLPWELSKGFDGSAAVSAFLPITDFSDIQSLHFNLILNGQSVQNGNTASMIFDINTIIEFSSRFFTLEKGDIIFTGTPSGVGKLHKGDKLKAYLEDKKLLEIMIN